MCGLFGAYNAVELDIEKCLLSLNQQTHRGPDQYGFWNSSNIFIGHRRLSILDLSESGRQPMISDNVIITVNGEIYNFIEIRNELIELGFSFSSNSDSEVVLHGYKAWGIANLLKKIDGMYAIQILDTSNNKIYLARDRYGIKPLYYSLIDNDLVWASELKSIVAYTGIDNLAIDNTAIYDYLTYLYIPSPKTMYKSVFKLEPATILEYSINNAEINLHRYWHLEDICSDVNIDINAARNQLKSLIDSSVNEQMVSDVPVGFFLSGGVDSSVVVASASCAHNNIHTFSIGFDDENHDETFYASVVAERFGCIHSKTILSVDDVYNSIGNLVKWYDEPFADTSAFPSYLVSKVAKEKVTVALTGDGGDEVFGGYHWYAIFRSYRKIALSGFFSEYSGFVHNLKVKSAGLIFRVIDKVHRIFFMDDLELYCKLLGGLSKFEKKHYAKQLGIPEDYDDYWYFRKFYDKKLPVRTRLQVLDFNTYLHDDILTKVDRVSMAVSLECRIPFLKKEIVEFVFKLPEEVRYCDNELKGLLKYTFKGILPDNILYRRKKGFSIPIHSWKKKLMSGYKTKQEAILKLFISGETLK